MRAVFYTRLERGHVESTDERETNLAEALQAGARAHGDDVEIRIAKGAYDKDIELDPSADLLCMAGVKSRFWLRAYARAGIPWCYFDKGYIRERAEDQWLVYWRMSVNMHHPVRFLETASKDADRANFMEFDFKPWRENRGAHIIVDGGSEKNFKFNNIVPEEATIDEVHAHCVKLVAKIRGMTKRPVIYRPKPSSPNRIAIDGTEFAYKTRKGVHKKDANYDLNRAHVVVTYASALSYDAHRIGIPSIVLANGPTRPIMSTSLDDIEKPRLATYEERRQWLNNLAWCQFDMKEIRSGLAWGIVKEMLACTPL